MELKECPFCGMNDAAMYRNYNACYRNYFVWVECDCCGGRGKAVTDCGDPAEHEWNTAACQKAAKVWNRRPGD